MSKAKITVTMERELLEDLDRDARMLKESRSRALERVIRSWKKTLLQRQLIEGYRAMSDEDLKVAEQNLPVGYEVLK
jgi:metal-responsive CopG/Arc/MetJ family transcriptional regulator